MWAVGVSLAVLTPFAGWVISANADINNKVDRNNEDANKQFLDQVKSISEVKTKVERIPIIENKVDALLQNRGINPISVTK